RIVADAARHLRRRQSLVTGPLPSLPRILEHPGPHRSGEVEPARSGIAAVECGEDPKRLRIALETVIEVQQRPRHPVELLLAEVAERRMPEIVSGRCRLHHHRIAPAEVADELTGAFV